MEITSERSNNHSSVLAEIILSFLHFLNKFIYLKNVKRDKLLICHLLFVYLSNCSTVQWTLVSNNKLRAITVSLVRH